MKFKDYLTYRNSDDRDILGGIFLLALVFCFGVVVMFYSPIGLVITAISVLLMFTELCKLHHRYKLYKGIDPLVLDLFDTISQTPENITISNAHVEYITGGESIVYDRLEGTFVNEDIIDGFSVHEKQVIAAAFDKAISKNNIPDQQKTEDNRIRDKKRKSIAKLFNINKDDYEQNKLRKSKGS